MLKLIHSDLYRSFHRPYLFALTGFFSILAILFNLMFSVDTPIEKSLQFSLNYMKFLPLFAVMIVDIVMAEENKFSTLKNTISFGHGRNRVYVGKLITSVILSVFCAVIAFLFYMGSAFWRMDAGKELTPTFMEEYLLRILVMFLLFTAALFVAMLFVAVFQKKGVYVFAFIGFLLILPLVFSGLGLRIDAFRFLYMVTIFGQAEGLYSINTAQLYEPVLIAVLHMVICDIIGTSIFRRQEIN